jgi:DNA-binding CsgD family transcriptional regulator
MATLKSGKLKKVSQEDFSSIYQKKPKSVQSDWKKIFDPVIRELQSFSFSPSLWFLADFHKGQIIHADGNFESLSSVKKEKWIGLSPMEMAQFFHPADVEKMQAFVVYIAGMYAGITPKDQNKVKASILFRLLNSKKQYQWCQMDYPGMHYENGIPHFLLFRISDISHLTKEGKCCLFVHDQRNKENTMFYCEDEQVVLKPYHEEKPLSQREMEVISCLMKGLISKEIATVLKISKNTVENHKQNIFAKTGTKNLAELISYAHRNLGDKLN